jgi:hypothetical protein
MMPKLQQPLKKANTNNQDLILLEPITLSKDNKTVGTIVNLEGAHINNTVADSKFQKKGGYISFGSHIIYDNWNRQINGIYVPPIPVTYEMTKTIAVLHPIAVRANTVARVYEAVNKNEQNLVALIRSVKRYFLELTQSIFGKSGVYNRYILGPRLKNSFRGVIIPGCYTGTVFNDSYEWVGIPRKVMTKLGIGYGQCVIIGRDPTIWFGSVEILRAYTVEHDAIEIHPLLLPQLAGDHDGDQIWGYFPDADEKLGLNVGNFVREHSRWTKNFNDSSTDPIDWDKFSIDQDSRMKVTGLSISPSDIIEESNSLQRILDYCSGGKRSRGKANFNELIDTCNGIPLDKWKNISEMINQAQLAMKVYMGPIGLLALRLMVLGHFEPHLSKAAHLLSERCAQTLLDSKHLTFEQIKDYRPTKIFEILNLSNPTIKNSKDMLSALKLITNCDEHVLPILEHIAVDGRGLARLSKEDFPIFEGITFTASASPEGYMPDSILNGNGDLKDEGIFTYAFYEGYDIKETINDTI